MAMSTSSFKVVSGLSIVYQPTTPNIPITGVATTKFTFNFTLQPLLISVKNADITTRNFTAGYQIVSANGFVVQSASAFKDENNTATVDFTDYMAIIRNPIGNGVQATISTDLAGPYTIRFMQLLDSNIVSFDSANVITATDNTTQLIYTSYTIPYRTDPLNANYLTNFPSSVPIVQNSEENLYNTYAKRIVLLTSPLVGPANPDITAGNIDFSQVVYTFESPNFNYTPSSTEDFMYSFDYRFNIGIPTGRINDDGTPGFTKQFSSVSNGTNNYYLTNTTIPEKKFLDYQFSNILSATGTSALIGWSPTGTTSSVNFTDPTSYWFCSEVISDNNPKPLGVGSRVPPGGYVIPTNWAGTLNFEIVAGAVGLNSPQSRDQDYNSANFTKYGLGEQIKSNVGIPVYAGDTIYVQYNDMPGNSTLQSGTDVTINIVYGTNNPNYGVTFTPITAHCGQVGADGTSISKNGNYNYSPTGYTPYYKSGSNSQVNRRTVTTIDGTVYSTLGRATSYYKYNPQPYQYNYNGSFYTITLTPDITLSRDVFGMTPGSWYIRYDGKPTNQIYTTTVPTIPSGFRSFPTSLPNPLATDRLTLIVGFWLHKSQLANTSLFFKILSWVRYNNWARPPPSLAPPPPPDIADSLAIPVLAPSYPPISLKTGISTPNVNLQTGGLYNNTVRSNGTDARLVLGPVQDGSWSNVVGYSSNILATDFPVSFNIIGGGGGTVFGVDPHPILSNTVQLVLSPGQSGETLDHWPPTRYTVKPGDVITLQPGRPGKSGSRIPRSKSNPAVTSKCLETIDSDNTNAENTTITITRNGQIIYKFIAHGGSRAYNMDTNVGSTPIAEKLTDVVYYPGKPDGKQSGQYKWGITQSEIITTPYYDGIEFVSCGWVKQSHEFRGSATLTVYYDQPKSFSVAPPLQTSYPTYECYGQNRSKTFTVPNKLADGITTPSIIRYVLVGGGASGSAKRWRASFVNFPGQGYTTVYREDNISNGQPIPTISNGGGSGQQTFGIIPVVPGDVVTITSGLGGYYAAVPPNRLFSYSDPAARTIAPIGLENTAFYVGDCIRFTAPFINETYVCRVNNTGISPLFDIGIYWNRADYISNIGNVVNASKEFDSVHIVKVRGGDSVISVESQTKGIQTYTVAHGGNQQNGGTDSGYVTPYKLFNITGGNLKIIEGQSTKMSGNDSDINNRVTVAQNRYQTRGAASSVIFTSLTNAVNAGAGGSGVSDYPLEFHNRPGIYASSVINPSSGLPESYIVSQKPFNGDFPYYYSQSPVYDLETRSKFLGGEPGHPYPEETVLGTSIVGVGSGNAGYGLAVIS